MEKEKPNLISRPPVVVVLGHVDHGKTSLLDAIRKSHVAEKESGGITQHIGAYQIEHPSPDSGQVKKITFIDTPGHEAFSAMRSRGAKIADIALLVIAAEESIKPQTKEAIKHIKEAKLPFIVVLNKIDKPQSDPEKVKRELMKEDIMVESFGGKVPSVNTSATTGKGINELIEIILLMAELEDLKADISKSPGGTIIESYMSAKRGPIATLIVRDGILKEGDILGTNSTIGKIKTLENFQGDIIKEAFPSTPVVVLGFEKAPKVGEEFKIFEDIESAKKEIKEKELIFSKKTAEGKTLNIIIKADVSGSLEAIEKILQDIPQKKASFNIIKAEVGEINDSDIKLAKTSQGLILGFRVKTNLIAQKIALREKIRIMTFEIIYELAQTAREALERKLSPEIVKKELGRVKILATFKKDKKERQIVGGKVILGEIKRGVLAEVIRDKEKVGSGKIIKLQKEKQDVDLVEKGREFGLLFEGNVQIQENDILEAFSEEKQKSTL